MKKIFTHPETWLGGFHELAMEFDQPSTELCNSAMSALWDYPDLKGCYRDPASEPHEQNIIVPSWTALDAYGHLRGVLRLEGQDVACGCYAIKEDNGPVWLGFYVPMGCWKLPTSISVLPIMKWVNGAKRRTRLWLPSADRSFNELRFRWGSSALKSRPTPTPKV